MAYKIASKRKAWLSANKDRMKEYWRQYYLSHRDELLSRASERRRANKSEKMKYDKKRRTDKRESIMAYDKIRYRSKDPAALMLSRVRQRAKRKGIAFALTIEDIQIPARCPALGILLERKKGSGMSANSPSLDRIVPALGYVPGNVAVISGLANAIKTSATSEQIRRVADWLDTIPH